MSRVSRRQFLASSVLAPPVLAADSARAEHMIALHDLTLIDGRTLVGEGDLGGGEDEVILERRALTGLANESRRVHSRDPHARAAPALGLAVRLAGEPGLWPPALARGGATLLTRAATPARLDAGGSGSITLPGSITSRGNCSVVNRSMLAHHWPWITGDTKTLALQRLLLFAVLLPFLTARAAPAEDGTPADGYAGSSACAACHAVIYQSYSATPMALSSGKVGTGAFQESLAATQFFHARSGVRYRVFKEQSNYFFEFARDAFQTSSPEIRGRRRLDYFIGSGAVGRSYLFSVDRFLFQAPVSYYSMPGQWNLSPGYEQAEQINLTRPIEAGCLECHASRLQPVAGTQNRYGEPPFLEGGVSCERCHGPGKQHISRMSRGQMDGPRGIVNPTKLEPLRRDSVCAQCHLTGEARISKPGRSLSTFRPGDLLSDHIVSFLWSSGSEPGLKVTGHFEKLWQSACKKASADRLSCLSCHNPHAVPAGAERKEYFRQRCLACHQNPGCKLQVDLRAQNGNDCVACHMPKDQAVDVTHRAVFTDHSIPRVNSGAPLGKAETTERSLIPFWGSAAETRDLGLAYAERAVQEGNDTYYARAFEPLKKVEAEEPGDGQALEQLAYLYDRRGDETKAMALYERALRANPARLVAAVNLGTLLARRGRFQDAIRLWEDALSRNPGLEAARVYLAVAYLRSGNPTAAEAALLKALEYSPDSPPARRLLLDLRQKKGRASK
jgi:hypothetical protein